MFAVSVAVATFLENDFGADTARAQVYDAPWFIGLLTLAGVNLLGSMIVHRVYVKGKRTILLFHLAFLLILIGAAITRYTS